MKTRILTTLAAGLLAVVATPALAGEIDFEGLTLRDGAPSVDSSDTLPAGSTLGTTEGVTFHDLFADRDDGPTNSGAYEGFATYFSSATVASNISLGIAETPVAGGTPTTRYESLVDVTDVNSTPWFEFDTAQTSVAFDFIANFGTSLTVELWQENGQNPLFSSVVYPAFDGQDMPTPSTVSFYNGLGFDSVRLTIAGTQPHYFAMDDLQFSAAVVPLPPAAYMGLGLLAGIGILRRLRRRSV